MKRFLEESVKKIFNICGFTIHKRGRRRTTLAEVIDHVLALSFKPKTVIDVGVAEGTFELYRFQGARYLLIEPLKEFEPILKSICRKYPGEYVLAAASDKSGSITLYVHDNLSSSSILKERDSSFVNGVPRKVAAVTIDDLCKERSLKGPYVIKIDVQGAELKVLEGAKKTLKNTELIIIEVSLFQFYINGPQFWDVVAYMKERGFVVYDFVGGHNRPFDNALAQIDVVFVKEDGIFRQHHGYHRVNITHRV